MDDLGIQAINFACKTEHLQWHLSLSPYKPAELNEAEIEARLQACAAWLKDSNASAARLSAGFQDAYFELVG